MVHFKWAIVRSIVLQKYNLQIMQRKQNEKPFPMPTIKHIFDVKSNVLQMRSVDKEWRDTKNLSKTGKNNSIRFQIWSQQKYYANVDRPNRMMDM